MEFSRPSGEPGEFSGREEVLPLRAVRRLPAQSMSEKTVETDWPESYSSGSILSSF